MSFPTNRLRRLRRTDAWRRAVRETTLSPADLVYPLFVVDGDGVRNPVGSMPGVEQLSVDQIVREAAEATGTGDRGRHPVRCPAR
jgi:porphobilinogen synthase